MLTLCNHVIRNNLNGIFCYLFKNTKQNKKHMATKSKRKQVLAVKIDITQYQKVGAD